MAEKHAGDADTTSARKKPRIAKTRHDRQWWDEKFTNAPGRGILPDSITNEVIKSAAAIGFDNDKCQLSETNVWRALIKRLDEKKDPDSNDIILMTWLGHAIKNPREWCRKDLSAYVGKHFAKLLGGDEEEGVDDAIQRVKERLTAIESVNTTTFREEIDQLQKDVACFTRFMQDTRQRLMPIEDNDASSLKEDVNQLRKDVAGLGTPLASNPQLDINQRVERHSAQLAQLRVDLDRHINAFDKFRKQLDDPEKLEARRAHAELLRTLQAEQDEVARRMKDAIDMAEQFK